MYQTMSKELPEDVKNEISSYVRGLLEERQKRQEEYDNYFAELRSNGAKIRSADRSKLKRQQRSIERLDGRLERRGFISRQDLQVTSKTIEIGSGLGGVHPKTGFNTSPKRQSTGGNVPRHPWQVTLRTENGVTQYKVDFNSTLYSGLASFDNIEVTGLDFWATASAGYLYLFGVVENGICTDASIQGPEEIPSDRVDLIDGEQNSFSTIIAYLYDDGNGGIAVQQRAFHDLTLINTCINGVSSLYPIAT